MFAPVLEASMRLSEGGSLIAERMSNGTKVETFIAVYVEGSRMTSSDSVIQSVLFPVEQYSRPAAEFQHR